MSIENINLTSMQIDRFLKKIKVKQTNKSLDFLNEIILGIFTNIPFQNLTLINENKRASNELIIEHMISGIGGLCNVRNGFLYVLLNSIGFKVDFLSASMDIENCHIILLVTIEEKKYLVDTGNGYPYLEAMDIGSEKSYIHPYCTYRVVTNTDNSLCVQHKMNGVWKTNFSFFLELKVFSSFNDMLNKQYTHKGFGPFLTGIRINKWSKGGGTIIRNRLLFIIESSNKKTRYKIKDFNDFEAIIEQYFLQDGLSKLIDIKKTWEDIYNENSN